MKPLNILDDDCLNRPPPPKELGLREESPASSKKILNLLLSLLLKSPKTLLLQLGIPGVEFPVFWELLLNLDYILLGRLLMETVDVIRVHVPLSMADLAQIKQLG